MKKRFKKRQNSEVSPRVWEERWKHREVTRWRTYLRQDPAAEAGIAITNYAKELNIPLTPLPEET